MKICTLSITAVLVLGLLSACTVNPGMMAATSTPKPLPTQTENYGDLLDQAAGQAPFTLLVPDESKLPFEIDPIGLEILPGLKTQPFVVSQSYRVRESVIRITQTSQTGQIPAKAIGEAPVRGVVGYWVVLNAGERVLYWEENGSSLTIGGDLSTSSGQALKDEDILILAEALVPRQAGTQVIKDDQPTNPDASRLVESLTRQGFDLQLVDTNPLTAMLAPASGVAYQLGEGWLHIHWYPDEQAARQKVEEIIAEPSWAIIDWVAKPHFFRCESAIALYLGSDEVVLTALQDQCGAPFAPVEHFALPLVAPTPSARLSGATATYTDPVIGYSLDYPNEWYVQGEPGWTAILTSFPLEKDGRGGLDPDQAKIDLLPTKPYECGTLQQLVEQVHNGEGEILWEQQWLLVGETPAVRMQRQSEVAGEVALLLTVINGRCLTLAGYGDTSLFDAISTSLRPNP